jgi:hypothetical protein
MAAAARTHRFRPLHALQAQQLKVVRAAVHETLAKLSAHEARLLKRLHQETAYGGTHQPTHSLLQIDTRERPPAPKSLPAAAAHVPSAALAEHDRIGDADTCSGRSAAAPMRQRVAVETLRRNCEVEGVPRSGAMDEESGTNDVKAFTAYGVRLGSTSTASSALNADLCDARGPPRVKRRKATKAKCSVVVSRIGTLRVGTPGNALAVAGAIHAAHSRPRPAGHANSQSLNCLSSLRRIAGSSACAAADRRDHSPERSERGALRLPFPMRLPSQSNSTVLCCAVRMSVGD